MEIEYDWCSKRIIRATYGLLQKGNIEIISIDNIANEAGTNSRTIYRKFKNKKDLIESTINYYLKIFIKKLEDIFSFNGDEKIGDYLNTTFMQLLNLPDEDFGIVKIAIGEVNYISEKKCIISRITDVAINKLEEYFKIQQEKGNIRNINVKPLSVICFSLIFQLVILSRVQHTFTDLEVAKYSEQILDIIYNGIKLE